MEKSTRIYGIRAVMEAIDSGESIDKVFLQKGLRGSLSKALEASIRKNNINHAYVPAEKLNRLTKSNHQGVVANIAPIAYVSLESMVDKQLATSKAPLFVLLDRISDVRNFGAIIRSAECTGVDGIIVPRSGSAPINADTVKTSAGSVFNIPIAKVDHLKDAIFYLQASGIDVVAATEKAKEEIYDIPLKGAVAIVMGAEDSGISHSVLKLADYTARLPMKGSINSLNVSVACGVFLYEAVRQRNS